MQRQAFERDGEVYYVEHHEHGRVMIYGPAPPQEASSLVLLLQPATSHDKHAVRRGVSRRVVTGQHALDEVSWVDTRLSDAEVAGLFDGPSGDAVAGVVRYRRGRLRIRPKWTTLEFRPRGK